MLRFILLVLSLIVFPMAYAETDTIQWEPPTERVNGDALDPLTDIASYELRCWPVSNAEAFVSIQVPGLTETGEYTINKSEVFEHYGDHTCSVAAIDTFGLMSDRVEISNPPISYFPPAPRVPTSVIVVRE